MSALTTHTNRNQREGKGKGKEMNKKKIQQAIESQRKEESKIT
jgi:hypothetical protein